MKYYLNKFKTIAHKLNNKVLKKKQFELEVGFWFDSVVLKLQKKTWTNKSANVQNPESSIFFSLWVNEKGIKNNKMFYNIHALKLRQLTGYSIESRKFAESFRKRFKVFQDQWPNVSVSFGPQTLMQGWIEKDLENLEFDIIKLVNQFLKIHFIIDELLNKGKKIKRN
ncbi:MAG: hypothetical protein M3R36_04275 [Bacteroidota bacterium]|nr:hypothetical protein [Bacteroidota bacterium]